MNFKQAKTEIRRFMQEQYSDERLAMLLAHAQEGKLAFYSCCCFAGIPSAIHSLRGREDRDFAGHAALDFLASDAYATLAMAGNKPIVWNGEIDDAKRRRILIPMIRAEQLRRERLASERAKKLLAEALSEV